MAHVEVISQINGDKARIMNVTEAVGPKWGMPDDVVLVKALLATVLPEFGVPASNCSSPTSGTLDSQTLRNIKLYQESVNSVNQAFKSSQRLAVDGRVSRARGNFSYDKNHPWTISYLNYNASLTAQKYGWSSFAALVVEIYPNLAEILKLDANDV